MSNDLSNNPEALERRIRQTLKNMDVEAPPVVEFTELPVIESEDYILMGDKGQHLRIDVADLTSDQIEDFERELNARLPSFKELMADDIATKILIWLENVGLPSTFMYFEAEEGIFPVLTQKDMEHWHFLPRDQRLTAAQVLNLMTLPIRGVAKAHLIIVVQWYIDLTFELEKETYTNSEALILCRQVAEFIGLYKRFEISTNKEITRQIMAARKAASGPKGGVPAWEKALVPVVKQWCAVDETLTLGRLVEKVRDWKSTEDGKKAKVPAVDAIEAGIKRMEKYENDPLVIPNRGGKKPLRPPLKA